MAISDLIPAWSILRQVTGKDKLALGKAAQSSRQANLVPRTRRVFAASSAASAGAAAAMLTPVEFAGPARRLAAGRILLELAAVKLMKRRLGPFLAEPYEQEAGRYDKLAKAFSGVGATVMAFADLEKSRAASVAGGALILAGAACERWSVYKAGFQSAGDPKYTVMPQRERLRKRAGARRGQTDA